MKKRILSMLIGLTLLVSSLPVMAFETYGSFSYIEKDGEITITGTVDTVGYLSVPSRIDGVPVTGIDSFAFAYGSFSSLALPYTLTSIGSGAFFGCENIKAVTIPENVIRLEDSAFYGCSSLSSAKLPASVEYIGIDVFYGCAEDFVIKGYEATVAESYADEYGYEFESLGIAEDLSIASGSCGENAFWKLSKGGTLTVYGEGETSSADGAEVPWAEYKEQVKAVKVSEGITSLLNKAFSGMTSLEAVELPEGLISIGSRAFEKCKLIRATVIPSSVKTIGSMAFSNCDSLQRIIIPGAVESIGSNAFESCDDLKVVKLFAGVSEVGGYCFMNCGALYSVTLPETLEVIPSGCFSACNSLENIDIPEGVKNISYSAFSACPLKEVTLPVTVTSIYDRAFEASVIIKGYEGTAAEEYAQKNGNTFSSMGTPPDMVLTSGTWGENVSWAIDTNGILTISGTGVVESISSYSEYPWYGEGYTGIVVKKGITELADYMFYNTPASSVSLPSGLETIGMYAFATSRNITKVVIPEGVTEIGICAFRSCNSLSEVHIPSSVVMLRTDLYAFDRCPSSLTLYVYEGTIGEYAAQLKGTNYVSLPLAEERVVLEKKYDDNISWSVTNKRKLTVWADVPGALPGYTQFPWRSLKGISKVCVGKNITAVESFAFYELTELKEIEFSEYVGSIENTGFGTISGAPVVKGYSGSVAEEFAKTNGYSFESLGEAPSVIVAEGSYAESEGGWSIDSRGILTLGGKGIIEDWRIPWSADYNKQIKKVVIAEGVNYINYGLLYQLENVTEAVLPVSFIMVEEALFPYDTVIYGYSGTRAESWAEEFGYDFESLGEAPYMIIAEGTAGDETEYTLDSNGLLTISGYGRAYNSPWMQFAASVKKVYVDKDIKGFSSNPFSEMPNLTEAEFSSDMEGLPMGNMFYACPRLEKIVFPPIAVMQSYFVQDCDGLKEIILPNTLLTMNGNAIYGCDNLERVEFPPSVTTISGGAITNCGVRVKIAGYDGTKAESYARSKGYEFVSMGKPALKEPVSGEIGNISWYLGTDGVLTLDGEGALYIDYYFDIPWYDKKDFVEKVVVGGGIDYMGSFTFYEHNYLKEAVIMPGVREMGDEVFTGCQALEKVSLPDGFERIGGYAFGGCYALKEITIPSSVHTIEDSFYDVSDGFVIKGYTYSAAEEYALENWISFESIGIVERRVIETGTDGNGISWEFDNYGELKISGFGAMADYVPGIGAPWKDYNVKTVTIGDDIISIGAFAFSGMYSIRKISLGKNVERIGDGAFYECGSAEMLYLPDSVWFIGSEAFVGYNFGIVTGKYLDYIGANAFEGIRVYGVRGGALERYRELYDNFRFLPLTDGGVCGDGVEWSFDIREKILEIKGNGRMHDYPDVDWVGTAPWYELRGDINKITVGEGVTYIGEGVFHFVRAEEITLPSTLREIGPGSFEYGAFYEVVIPEGCVSIGERAFQWMDNIERVVIPESVSFIAREAFGGNDNLILCVYEGSAGEEYAINHQMEYEYMKKAPKLMEVFAKEDGEEILIAADGINLEGYTCYASLISESGAVVKVIKLEYDGAFTGSVSADGASEVKCFIWSSLEEMKPLCASLGAQIRKNREVAADE